jgi:hypothetical protein
VASSDPNVDDLPESVDLEPVRRDQPVEYAGRVQRLGFREGLIVAAALVVVLVGAGVIAIGSPPPRPSASLPPIAAASATPVPVAPVSPSPSPRASPPPAGPTPAATPSIVCDARPTTSPPYVNLITPEASFVGANAATGWLTAPAKRTATDFAADATVALGEYPVLSVNFAACALEWRITVDGHVIQEQSNPAMDPGYARQGYFVLGQPITMRTARLQLDLHYPAGWSSSTWQMTVDSWPVPQAFAVVAERATLAEPGCGFAINLDSGASGAEACRSTVPHGVQTVFVAPGTEITFRVTNAIFYPASAGAVGCGHVRGTPPAFVVDPTCAIAIDHDLLGDLTMRAPSGPLIATIDVTGCATIDGGQACGSWFFGLDSKDPAPTAEPPESGGGIGD